MNLILFEPAETTRPLPLSDPRAEHVVRVLGRKPGDTFDAGLINGPRGKATVVRIGPERLDLEFAWDAAPPPPPPDIELLIGLPRPQTARKILAEATSAGVRRIHFFNTDKGEPSYASSTLWSSGEWRRHVRAGAEQAFCTHLPEVTWMTSLEELANRASSRTRLALDNYESTQPLATARAGVGKNAALTLAFGPERGWSASERNQLRKCGFALVDLGPRVLRSETAVIFALGVCAARA